MARKSPKCPPIVEANQMGCVWNFSAMFDHHHCSRHHGGRTNRRMLSDVSHGRKIVTGTGRVTNQEITVNFDEQLRSINIESKKKTEKSVKNFVVDEVSFSKHTKKNKEVKRDSSQKSTDIHSCNEEFCSQIPRKNEKDSRLGETEKNHENFDEKNPSFLDEKPGYSMEVWKSNTEKSFWEGIKSRNEHTNEKNKNPRFVKRIVVLKPGQIPVGDPVDVGCGCSYRQPHHQSTSNQQIVKHARFSFSDIRKRLKNTKKPKNAKESCKDGDESRSQTLSLAIVPYSKQEPNVFVEAKRHLAERLKQIAKGEASSSQKVPQTLERILLSSPKHDSTATLTTKREETRVRFLPGNKSQGGGGQSLETQKENSLSHSNPTKRKGYVEITGTSYFLQESEKISIVEGSRLDFSLDSSSPKSNCICKVETMDNDRFRGENPSPVSVLESCFVDNVCSPTSTIDSVEHHIQPHRLDFEDQSQTSSPPYQKTRQSSSMDDKGFISAYVTKVNRASQLNWDDFLAMECPEDSLCDHKLLHDCIKDALISTHEFYFDCLPFEKPKIRPFSLEEHVVNEVIEKVNWHTRPPTIPRTLDQLMRKDIAKSGKWVDVKLHSKEVVFDTVDEILQELTMELIFDFPSQEVIAKSGKRV